MSNLSSTTQGIFYLLAVVTFVLAAFSGYLRLIAIGLALFAFVAMWGAFTT